MSLPVLTVPQQLCLYEIRRAGGIPVYKTGGGKRAWPRSTIAKTTLVEKYIGKDGNKWIRLAPDGYAFLNAISALDEASHEEK